jgi:hypothetical protein
LIVRQLGRWWGLQEVQHVLGRLPKVVVAGHFGKGNSLRKKINLENVTFGERDGKIALVAPIVLG